MAALHGHRWLVAGCVCILVAAILMPLIVLAVAGCSPTDSQNSDSRVIPPALGGRQAVLLCRSIALAAGAGVLGSLLGLAMGYSLSRMPRRRQPLAALLVLVPMTLPPFILALAWISLLDLLGRSCHGWLPSVLVLGMNPAPIAALLCWAGFVNCRGSCVEAGELSNSKWDVFFHIQLGMIRPHLLSSFLLIALWSFSDYAVPSLFRVHTYPVFVFAQFAAFNDLRGALLASWPYVLLPVAALLVWQRWAAGARLFESLGRGWRANSAESREGRSVAWAVLPGVFVCLTTVCPLVALAIHVGGLGGYAVAWRGARSHFLLSGVLSAAVATVAVVAGAVVAAGIAKSGPRLRPVLEYVSLLPVALPGTLFGLGLILTWSRLGWGLLYGTTAMLCLLCFGRFLPYAVWSIRVGMRQVHGSSADAASLVPRSRVMTYARVFVPLIAPAALVGWVSCFALSLRELTGTLLVTPPGVETLAVRIYALHHYGAGRTVAALSMGMVLMSACAFLAVYGLSRVIRPC